MNKIIVKSGVKQLNLFKEQEFPYFEAYLRGDESLAELKLLVTQKMRLFCIHLPAKIKLDSEEWLPINFCSKDIKIKTNSWRVLQNFIDFANQHNVPHIIIHLGTYNNLLDNKQLLLEKAATNFNELDFKNVKVCVENVPLWVNLSFENESIMANENDFLYLKERCQKISIAFDVDHLSISAVFSSFYPEFKQKYSKEVNFQEFQKEMENQIYNATNKEPSKYLLIVEKAIEKFLTTIKPDYIHAIGTDFCNYRFINNLPLCGEAIPLNYDEGTITNNIKDRLNHTKWLSLLPPNIPLCIEIMLRPNYDYISEIKKSSNLLKELIAQINKKELKSENYIN
jgi:hypothetical protein